MKSFIRTLAVITLAYIVGWAFFAAVYYLVSPIISVVVNLAIAPNGKTDTVYRTEREATDLAIDRWNSRSTG